MWKKSIVLAQARPERACAFLAYTFLTLFAVLLGVTSGADLVIEIPDWDNAAEGGKYRLDYQPAQGDPTPNATIPSGESTINFQGQPGTQYHLKLYYSNATAADLLIWNQTIITAPDPPTNLTITEVHNKEVTITWLPPVNGDYTGFRFKVLSLDDKASHDVSVDSTGNSSLVLRELTPGATYELHAFTLLLDKESATYFTYNFTTKPNTPGKFIVWFRNETALLVLWSPPNLIPAIYSHYKVSIEPRDARESEKYIEKDDEISGSAQSKFEGLVPGRVYNISVQTVSNGQLSAFNTAQYRTVPLRPRNVSVELADTAFRVSWLPPDQTSEFEKYKISVKAGGGTRQVRTVLQARGEPITYSFDGMEPGVPYMVTVKTVSGKVTSWPASKDFVLRPLPVRDLRATSLGGTVELAWTPSEGSSQDEYRVLYHEEGNTDDDITLNTTATKLMINALLPSRNYSLGVAAVSRGVVSNITWGWVSTPPPTPVLNHTTSEVGALSSTWGPTINSRLDTPNRTVVLGVTSGADLVIRIPDRANAAEGGKYRFDYQPAQSDPTPNATVLTGNETIITAPDPPTNLTATEVQNKEVTITWSPPANGAYTGFRFKVLSPEYKASRDVTVDRTGNWSLVLRELTPGATYQLHAYSLLLDKESASYTSYNFTTKPNAPGKFIVWFRNETALLVLWLAPDQRDVFTHYKVSIEPRDAREFEKYVEKDYGMARPPQSKFEGLVPGRAYNISVQTVSNGQLSALNTAQYRTVPLRPRNVSVELADTAFRVSWLPPDKTSEFEKYKISVKAGGGTRQVRTVPQARGEPTTYIFDGMEPGVPYMVTVKTVSGKVTSWPASKDFLMRPLPVRDLRATSVGGTVELAWTPAEGSSQDEYRVLYHEEGNTDDDITLNTTSTKLMINALLPGRNYSLGVAAVSRGVASNITWSWANTPPPTPELKHTTSDVSALSSSWGPTISMIRNITNDERHIVNLDTGEVVNDESVDREVVVLEYIVRPQNLTEMTIVK